MNLLSGRSKTLVSWVSLVPTVAVMALTTLGQAAAQFYYPPYGYAFRRPIVEPEPNISPRRIAAILERHGYRLVGPLERRGDQIIASGIDVRGWRMRFIVDPYEGEVLSSRPVGPAFGQGGPRDGPLPIEPYEPADRPDPDEYGPRALEERYDQSDVNDPDERGERIVRHVGGTARRLSQSKVSVPRVKTATHSARDRGPRSAHWQAPKIAAAHRGRAPDAPASMPIGQSNARARTTATPKSFAAPASGADGPASAPILSKTEPTASARAPAARANAVDSPGALTVPAQHLNAPRATNDAGTKSNSDR
jgi:hypothetical protein